MGGFRLIGVQAAVTTATERRGRSLPLGVYLGVLRERARAVIDDGVRYCDGCGWFEPECRCGRTQAPAPAWEGLNPPYSTIVADPPWAYTGQVGAWDERGEWLGKSKPMPYSSMSVEKIAELPVADLSRPGAHLYLWTTNRYLEQSYGVARSWGFEPATVLVWCKVPKGRGPGGRFSLTTEFVLFCRDRRRAGRLVINARAAAGLTKSALHRRLAYSKSPSLIDRWEEDDALPTEEDWRRLQAVLPSLGDRPEVVPPQVGTVETTWFQWPRGPHSVKPPAFGDLVEHVSPGPYVELFARAPRLGWDSWGKGYEQVVA